MADQATVDKIANAIKIQESGGQYNNNKQFENSGGKNTASGAYQFINPTWKSLTQKYGIGTEYSSAYMAPAGVQDEVAKKYIADILDANNGNITAVPNTWYTGNASGAMTAKQLAANNGYTSQQYTADWIKKYNKINGTDVSSVQPNADGSTSLIDDRGKVVGVIEQSNVVYTGDEQRALISSMIALENNESNWESNCLDEYSDYIYNLELFLVDSQDVVEFMNTPPSVIENDGWPAIGKKKVVIAKTGETAEFTITDLVIDSVGASSNLPETVILANAATSLSFNITRVGNARLTDGIQDAVALAGFMDISTAVFFVKVKFTRIDERGNASSVPNTTKVLPFVISKLIDISTSTDQKGTTATLEGVVLRNYAVTSKAVGQIKYKITSTVDKSSAHNTINAFLDKLNESIRQNSYGVDDKYNLTYHYEPDEYFTQVYSNVTMSDLYRTGPGGAEAANAANPANSTIAIANNTLEVQPTTNVVDVIRDVLLKTDSIKSALTTPNKTFTDLFSIEVDYTPKVDGFNILTKSQGADVTYRICIKQEIIEQNVNNQIEQLSNAMQTINTIVGSGRLKKKYYYYYTGKNDQIMQFDISLNNQLVKVQNEEFGVYFNVNQINDLQDILSNLDIYSDTVQRQLTEEFSNSTQSVSQLKSQFNMLKMQYATKITNIKNDFVNRIFAQTGGNSPVGEGTDAIVGMVNEHFADLNLTDPNTMAEFEARFQALEEELGLTDGSVYNEELRTSLRSLYDEIAKINQDLVTAQQKLSDLNSKLMQDQNNALGAALSDRISDFGLTDTDTTFGKLGIASNIATIEDLGTDIRRKLTPIEVAGILNFLSLSSARFISEELGAITDQKSNVELITRNDQKRSALARIKFREGWNNDTSMIYATMKIKGDPYWVQNYITAEMRSRTYQQNNYRTNNYSTAIGQNLIMVITNAIDGVDSTGQPIVSNLFRYLYVIKSIKSEFSNGLFTQTLDMVRFIMGDVFTEEQQADTGTDASGQPSSDTGLDDPFSPVPVPAGASITVSEFITPIEGPQ